MAEAKANGDDEAKRDVTEPTPIRPGTEGPERASATPTGAGRADLLDHAIGVLRARVEEEFRVTERLDSKSRQAFALAAGFFVIAQTVAFGSFGSVNGTESVLVGSAAIFAALAVLVTGHHLATGEELQEVRDLRPDAVVDWCKEATDDEYVSARIVTNLRDVAAIPRARELRPRPRSRRSANVEPAPAQGTSEDTCLEFCPPAPQHSKTIAVARPYNVCCRSILIFLDATGQGESALAGTRHRNSEQY